MPDKKTNNFKVFKLLYTMICYGSTDYSYQHRLRSKLNK